MFCVEFRQLSHLTSDAIKIEPNTVVFYYCLWLDFYCIRRYNSLTETFWTKFGISDLKTLAFAITSPQGVFQTAEESQEVPVSAKRKIIGHASLEILGTDLPYNLPNFSQVKIAARIVVWIDMGYGVFRHIFELHINNWLQRAYLQMENFDL